MNLVLRIPRGNWELMTSFTSPLPFSIGVLVVDQHLQMVKETPTGLGVKKSRAYATWGGK